MFVGILAIFTNYVLNFAKFFVAAIGTIYITPLLYIFGILILSFSIKQKIIASMELFPRTGDTAREDSEKDNYEKIIIEITKIVCSLYAELRFLEHMKKCKTNIDIYHFLDMHSEHKSMGLYESFKNNLEQNKGDNKYIKIILEQCEQIDVGYQTFTMAGYEIQDFEAYDEFELDGDFKERIDKAYNFHPLRKVFKSLSTYTSYVMNFFKKGSSDKKFLSILKKRVRVLY